MRQKILVIDDEPDVVELLDYNLTSAGYKVISGATGAEALQKAQSQKPDLIVLDVMLPGMDGTEVCKILRRDQATAAIPILLLTAKANEIDRILGLELGADDYVTKPFSPRELVLRIKGLLRRKSPAAAESDDVRIGELHINVPRHEVEVRGRRVTLTLTEFKLLLALARSKGRVLDRDRLLRDVWGYEESIDSRTVDTHMRRLREKIGPAARHLGTVRGVGYRFIED